MSAFLSLETAQHRSGMMLGGPTLCVYSSMNNARQTRNIPGTFRLFQAFGINVYVHWMWFLLLAFVLFFRPADMDIALRLATFIGIFAIVVLHEFGHAIACRQVGGRAEHIVIWLLGGVAFVQPPPRPGATFISIAAGPLVNVILIPILGGAFYALYVSGVAPEGSWLYELMTYINLMNGVVLVFNMMPVYPLDGGQILRSLLWFVMGPVRSLRVAAVIGIVFGALGFVALLVLWIAGGVLEPILLILMFFIMSQAFAGLRQAKVIEKHGVSILDPNVRRMPETPDEGPPPPADPYASDAPLQETRDPWRQ